MRRSRMAMGHVDPARVLPRPAGALFPGLCAPLYRHADAGAAARGRRTMGAGSLLAPKRPRRCAEGGQRRLEDGGFAEETGDLVVPQGSIGYRWPNEGEPKGRWNLEAKDGESGEDVRLALSAIDRRDDVVPVAFPYFGGQPHEHFPENDQGGDVLIRNVPVRRLALATAKRLSRLSSTCLCQLRARSRAWRRLRRLRS